MIAFRNTDSAETTVFGSSWFDEVACPAHGLRSEKDVIEGVVEHSCIVIPGGDMMCSSRHRQVREDIRKCNEKRHRNQQMRWQTMCCAPQKDRSTRCQEEKKKYLRGIYLAYGSACLVD